MTEVAVLGEPVLTLGYALAGAKVLAAGTTAEVLQRWAELPPEVGVVILTAKAAEALGTARLEAAVLTVVLPS
jgi:vacuolar-type H+-ATPase subunit F/Vma7